MSSSAAPLTMSMKTSSSSYFLRLNPVTVTSRSESGKPVHELFPALRGFLDQHFADPQTDALADCDVVFFAAPNGTAMQQVPALLDSGVRVIDLSADFRLKNADEWSHWYGQEHAAPGLLGKAVYDFESEFAKAHNVKHCLGVSSGTDGNHLASWVLGLGQEDEIIIPANTFIATAWGATLCGAKPVFVDCDPISLSLIHI